MATKRRPNKKKGTMDKILVFLAVILILFVIGMIVLFCIYQSVPDTLIASVFGICGCECGVMGWIKNVKEKQKEEEKEELK